MQINPDLIENFKFLTLEIRKELEEAVKCIEEPDTFSASKLSNSGDYADNLRNLITRKSYKQILNSDTNDKRLIDFMIALNTIATNLERIGDFCENVVRQMEYFTDPAHIKGYDYNSYFYAIFTAVDVICDAMVNSDIDTAIEICRAEVALDELCKRDLNLILEALSMHNSNSKDLITALMIFRYLERMGDSLLNIGEAIISANVGTKIKISQFLNLRETFETGSFEFEKLGGETKSGCSIEKLTSGIEIDNPTEVVFKEGKISKINEERYKLEFWEEIFPGLAPRVVEYRESGEDALILMEFLRGQNYQEILIGSNSYLLSNATKELINTIDFVWRKTIQFQAPRSGFINQLKKRLPDIISVHPDFKLNPISIGGIIHNDLESELDKFLDMEDRIASPFSVLIHGDLNNDNIIYNTTTGKLHLIDLHRSMRADYAQDVSVFLISNFRMPVFEKSIRERLNYTNLVFYRYVRQFAAEHADRFFELRLTLGLIRSLITSTRFILNEAFALELFNRAQYLLQKVAVLSPEEYEHYLLPEEVLCY